MRGPWILDHFKSVEGRIRQSRNELLEVYTEITTCRKADSDKGNGNGDNNANWGWTLPYKGQEPHDLKLVNVVLQEKVPLYGMVLGHCMYCGILYLRYRDIDAQKFLQNLKESQLYALRLVKDVCNGTVSPPINVEELSECGITETTEGLCKFCIDCSNIGERERKEQRKEGFPDCFGKSLNYCDRLDCKRREKRPGEGTNERPGCLPLPEEVIEYPVWLYRYLKLKEFGHYIPYVIVHRG